MPVTRAFPELRGLRQVPGAADGCRPNILWICTDQQRYDTVRALGNPHIRTPNLDRLCAEGTAFTHAHCQSPICTPSRASFLTGLYPSTVHGNINGNDRFRVDERIQLITRRLARAGYDCGLAGKLHLASAWNGVEERGDDGYVRFWYSHSPLQGRGSGNGYLDWLEANGVYAEVMEELSPRPGQPAHGRDPGWRRYREEVPSRWHQTTWCADRAIEFMTEKGGSPWLMSVNIFDPHPPFDAPSSYAAKYDPASLPPPLFRESDLAEQEKLCGHFFQSVPQRPGPRQQEQKASYYGMIALIDENVGRLLDCLESSGQRGNTIVVFMSDHGEMLGDHGLTQKGCRFYEGLVRVPLIISWPGMIRAGQRSGRLVELTDLAPTLADFAGIDLPWTHGYSLRPILEHGEDAAFPRNHVRCEYYGTLEEKGSGPLSHATMFRDQRYKLSVYHGSGHGELYDLQKDPGEFTNLWDDSAAQVLKQNLIRRSFDASILATDPGSNRVGRY
jgi:arylsulfatase